MRTCPTDGCGSGASIDRRGSPARSSTIARTARAYRRCRPVFPATPRRRPVCSALATRRVPRSDALRSPRRRVAEHTGRPPVPLVWMPRRDATGAVRVARCTSGVDVSLREALDLFVGSETFEGLLLAHDRPIHARAETGEAFVVAGLAVALDAPVLAVAPG